MNVCRFEECDREARTKGLCGGHYRQQHDGKELTPIREKRAGRGCVLEGCDKPHYAMGRCRTHYAYWNKNGTDERIVFKKDQQCTADGCELNVISKGLCKKHYSNRYYHERNANPRPIDTTHHNYKGDNTQSLETIHMRVRSSRGGAHLYWCTDCDKQAKDWSLKHDAAGKKSVTKEGRYFGSYYSLDVMDYEPRCQECHVKYDAKHSNKRSFKALRAANN